MQSACRHSDCCPIFRECFVGLKKSYFSQRNEKFWGWRVYERNFHATIFVERSIDSFATDLDINIVLANGSAIVLRIHAIGNTMSKIVTVQSNKVGLCKLLFSKSSAQFQSHVPSIWILRSNVYFAKEEIRTVKNDKFVIQSNYDENVLLWSHAAWN
jgi:hypothetical protein